MTEKLKQTIKEEVGKLSKENQEVINNFGWESIAEEIGKKNLILDDEINIFQAEILIILVGLEDPDFFAKNIEDEVGTSKAEAEKIANEVFQKIFTPITDLLIKNIKKSDKVKNASAEQNLNFILSGGDYGAFLTPILVEEGAGGGDSEKNHLAFGTPPQKGGEGNNTDDTVLPVFSIKK